MLHKDTSILNISILSFKTATTQKFVSSPVIWWFLCFQLTVFPNRLTTSKTIIISGNRHFVRWRYKITTQCIVLSNLRLMMMIILEQFRLLFFKDLLAWGRGLAFQYFSFRLSITISLPPLFFSCFISSLKSKKKVPPQITIKKRRESSRCKRDRNDRNDRYLLSLVLQQHCPASGFSLPSLVYSLQRNVKLAPGSPSLALLLTFLLHFLIFDDDDDRIKNMHLHKWCYYSVNSSSYFFSLFIFPFLFLPLSLFIIFHPPSVSCLFLYQESCSSSRESYSRGDLQFLGQKRYKSSGNLWFRLILQLCLNLIQALFETFLKLSNPNQQQPTMKAIVSLKTLSTKLFSQLL